MTTLLLLCGLLLLGLACAGVLALSLCRAADREDLTRELWEMFDDD